VSREGWRWDAAVNNRGTARRAKDAEKTFQICQAYKHAIDAGEDKGAVIGFLAQLHGVGRPAIWRQLRAGGVLPPYNQREEGGRGPKRKMAHGRVWSGPKDIDPSQYVERTACEFCGVRTDIGCRHIRA